MDLLLLPKSIHGFQQPPPDCDQNHVGCTFHVLDPVPALPAPNLPSTSNTYDRIGRIGARQGTFLFAFAYLNARPHPAIHNTPPSRASQSHLSSLLDSLAKHVVFSRTFTLTKTNQRGHPKKATSLPTTHFQVLFWFQGVYLRIFNP